MTVHEDLLRTSNPWAEAVPPPYVGPSAAPGAVVGSARPSPSVPAPSSARPSAPREPLTAVQRLGAVISIVGVLVCGFVAYELIATDLVAARSQELLRPRLVERMKVEESLASTDAGGGESVQDSRAAFGEATGDESMAKGSDEAGDAEEITRQIERPPLGEPIALLRIPSLGLEQVVVEGSGQTQLNSGPGHYRGSPLPGRLGNVVIAGRRSTYGAPFERLGSLRRGDRISIGTGRGTFDYRVAELRTVKVGQADVVGEDGTNKLTLITANSPFDATGRLVVTATLDGSRSPAPTEEDPAQAAARLVIPDAELGLQRDATAWAPAIIWFQALVALALAVRHLRSRWSPAALWVVATPAAIAVLVLWFESVSRLLPSTL